MNGEISTAPILPPPEPGDGPAALGVFAACSLQHDALSSSASSNEMTSRPSSLYPGESRIFGTHSCRNASIDLSPPGRFPSTHGSSCPSLQRSGVMKLNDAVVAAAEMSPGIAVRSTSFSLQLGPSM